MADELDPEIRRIADDAAEEIADQLGAAASPILGFQRAQLGARRFAALVEGHATLQAMALFLVMSAMTVPQQEYSDEALDAFRQDARDVRQAAAKWAKHCEELADHWQAQRQEHRRG